ncbi:MAG: carboxypeptidase regulatory-like domain-containing protein [Candidatus Pacebacteria bacterium]|jgi:prepilin-type N-terminal cleavage/methylation domain-containing protein|nr:carboxypeptidase regulatory-like domain-containing protein [Candidatus Paceibacterota bacterium]
MRSSLQRGFSLIELLIVAAIMALFIGGLFATLQTSLQLIADSRARMSALSVANDRLEYIRSLAYDAVGTVSGIPAGAIPQIATSTLNGFIFTERTLVEFIDDPADGLAGADTNGITTDYKRVKIEISWTQKNDPKTLTIVSNISPRSIETNVGGGTIRVNVTDSNVQPVSGASVRLINTTGTTSIDVTRSTDATGAALFGGAPAGSGYQVFVTRPGYSSEQTYQATTSLPNPSLLPVTLIAADVTTVNVQIDTLATAGVTLLTNQIEQATNFDFASTSDLATTTNTVIDSGALTLASTAGVFVSSGFAVTSVVAPSPLAAWQEIAIAESVPLQANRTLQLYTDETLTTLIPDTDLPGNSSGFASNRIDISTLDASTYPSFALRLALGTTDTSTSTRIEGISIYSVQTETPLVTNFTWRGNRTIGTLLDFSPVYKHSYATTTNSDGYRLFNNVEWDSYQVLVSGYDIAEACPSYPVAVPAGSNTEARLIMAPDSTNSLRVVITAGGQPVRGATVTLTRGSSVARISSGCGQVFFAGLAAESDYELTVSAPGFAPVTVNPLSISGDVVEEFAL